MSIRVCFVDLDGVVVDPAKRFKRAEEAKARYLEEVGTGKAVINSRKPELVGSAEKEATNLYWRTVFTPELVALDTLIEGAIDALATLAFNGWQVMLLTSRPLSMREATREWLFEQGYPVESPLIMKPPAAQYVKTVVWKALTIQMLVALYGADEVLVVDDEPVNIQEMQNYDVSRMRLCSSLAEAIAPKEQAS